MSGQRFEELDVWQKSKRLTVDIYSALRDCRDFAFKDQLTRSALSIPSNIAEGYERGSNKEFIRFLLIAKGSCGELRTQALIAGEIGIVPADTAKIFVEEAKEISYMLSSLIKTRKSFSS
jgi:four helix bundle protein